MINIYDNYHILIIAASYDDLASPSTLQESTAVSPTTTLTLFRCSLKKFNFFYKKIQIQNKYKYKHKDKYKYNRSTHIVQVLIEKFQSYL